MQPLTLLDGAVIVVVLFTTVLIGYPCSQQTSTNGKNKKKKNGAQLWLVAISMASAFVNAPTLIGFSNELYLHGPSFSLAQTIATVLSWSLNSLLLLPIFKQFNGPGVLRYIEARFSVHLRRLLASLFLLMNIVYQACALFVPTLALTTLAGLPKLTSVLLIVICSALNALYGPKMTSNGLHLSNLFHTAIMCLLMGTILATGIAQSGGFDQVWRMNIEGERLSWSNIFNLDHQTRHTAFNTVLGMTLLRTFLHGINPSQVQSALSLKNLRKAQLSQLVASFVFILTQTLATSIGLVLYSGFQGCDPLLDGQISRRETTLMHYIQTELNFVPAIRGIFLASTVCSTFTSMSTFFSTSASAIHQELVAPILDRTQPDDCKKMIKAKGFNADLIKRKIIPLLALTCVSITFFVVDKTNNLLQIIYTTFAIYSGPIVPCFLLGISTKFVTSLGMFIGCLLSLALGVYIKIHQTFLIPPTKPTLPISIDTCQQTLMNFRDSTDSPGLNNDVGGLLQISYFWLPFLLAIIASVVAVIVSVIDQIIAAVRTPTRASMRVFTITPLDQRTYK